ncbi:hypothetical protein TNCV_2762241 [Trichonephila clavipes]|nr:hypothetical protein TNCV_2762241 [Trichonephila clavipes]
MSKDCFLQPKQVRVGYLNDSRIPYVIKRTVNRIIPHPDFNYVKTVNDIALIELNHPLVCLDLPRPICLPTKNLSKVGNELVIAGWGLEKLDEELKDRCLAVIAKRSSRWSTASDVSRQLSADSDTTVLKQTVNRRLGHIGLYARMLLNPFRTGERRKKRSPGPRVPSVYARTRRGEFLC